MALMQIAEPGDSTAPHQHRLAVGIDLGTTHSLVATMRSGETVCLPDEHGQVLLPSVVAYGEGEAEVWVGSAAERQPEAIRSIKRWMGKALNDLSDQVLQQSIFTVIAQEGSLALLTPQGPRTPVHVSAEILRALRQRAEASLGDELVGAVITVPAYFDEAQRQATKDAARLAGLNVLRLLNEPTAAAIAYGLDQRATGTFVVYDLGGGTFDVSVLQLEQGLFQVLATGGDTALGGDDFDRLLCDDWLSWLRQQQIVPPISPQLDPQPSPSIFAACLQVCRRAKERLSERQEAVLAWPGEAAVPDYEVTADVFARLAQPLVNRTREVLDAVVRDAGLSIQALDGVVLVGGSTRMPVIRDMVAAWYGQAPLCTLDPDQVVAQGAAMQAHVLAGNRRADEDWLLLDVTPLSLGIETMGGLVERILPRHTTLPAIQAQDFTTYQDGQTAMAIHVVQGERDLVSENRSLARFELRGIPPLVAGAARIRVSFQVDADGLLTVNAQELGSGVYAEVVVKPSYGLSDESITAMLRDSAAHAWADRYDRAYREASVEAQRLADATQRALEQDGHLLAPHERANIDQAMQTLAELLAVAEQATGVPEQAAIDALDAATKALAACTDDFAARRMNQSIATALQGRRVAEI